MKNKFADRLTKLRKSSGMSQKAAAQKLGISQALLSHYEKGIRECGLDFVIKAAKALGVSTDYLLGLTDRLPTDSADAGIYEELNRKPKLYQARNNLQNAIDLIYSIAARYGNAKMNTELNSLLYADVYLALNMFCGGQESISDKDLFSLKAENAVYRAAAMHTLSAERLYSRIQESDIGFSLDRETLSNEFPANFAAVSGIIETVEKTAAAKGTAQ